MATALAFVTIALLLASAWYLARMVFGKGRRSFFAKRLFAALAATLVSLTVFGVLNDRAATDAGFESARDQADAKASGITDPTQWKLERDERRKAQAEQLERDQAKAASDEIEKAAVALRAEQEAADKVKQEDEAEQTRQRDAEAASKLAADVKAKEEAEKQALDAAEKQASCRKDIQCWGERATMIATMRCDGLVEKFAKNNFEWTDGWLEPKFTHYRWRDPDKGTVTVLGDKIKFQNGFGAWSIMTYECDVDPSTDEILDVRVRQGQL